MSVQTPPPLITLEHADLRRGSQTVLSDVTWTLREGQQWAIVGPNNSGKSTLAKAIGGQLPVTGGTIRYHGTAPDWASRPEEMVVYVAFDNDPRRDGAFLQSRWHAALETSAPTVRSKLSAQSVWRRNPYEVAAPRAAPAAFRRERRRLIARLSLRDLLDRRFDQLSDGEWRRVQITRALLRLPRLLILDNPFEGLDVEYRERLKHVLTSLMQDTQICLVAAEVSEIPEGIDHVLVLGAGRVRAQGQRGDVQTALETLERTEATTDVLRAAMARSAQRGGVPVIELRNVNVVHNQVSILQDIDWTVHQGERWALVGPNGAGKTTLLSLILGDHPQAYANHVALFGHRRGSGESIWEIKQRIGWVAPELHRHYPPDTSCLDVVCSGFFDTLGRFQRATADQEAAANAWMARLGIAQDRDRPLWRLSKGRQRLALIARALVKAPQLLILDEPCQNLDKQHRMQVLQALDEVLAASDVTMVYVSHRRDSLPHELTHVLELRDGAILSRQVLAPAHVVVSDDQDPVK